MGSPCSLLGFWANPPVSAAPCPLPGVAVALAVVVACAEKRPGSLSPGDWARALEGAFFEAAFHEAVPKLLGAC